MLVLPRLLLTPFTAMGQKSDTFDPLPTGARIISEKDGVRTHMKDVPYGGAFVSEISKERQLKEPGYTPEELRNAKPADIVLPDLPTDSTATPPLPKWPTHREVSQSTKTWNSYCRLY